MAATFYKAVTGEIPPAAMERFGAETLMPPNSLDAEVPGYVEKALLKALSLKASDRYQNMSEFKDAVTKGKKVETAIFAEKKKPLNKKTIPIIFAALVFLFAVASLIFTYVLPDDEIKDDKIVSEAEETTVDEDAIVEKDPVKTKTAPVPVVKKRAVPQKQIKKSVARKKVPEPVNPQDQSPPATENKGITMKGKNFVFSSEAPKGLTPQQYYKEGFKYELVRNYNQAEVYYNEACKAKFTNACYRLGKLKKDQTILQQVRNTYSSECKKGNDSSCVTLADMMINGEGGKKDPPQAVTTLANQCSKGSVNGCYLLAGLLEKGQSIQQDIPKARKYYLHSCDAGSKEGCVKYAKMLEQGIGGEKDIEKAKKYYGIACKRGVPKACMKAN